MTLNKNTSELFRLIKAMNRGEKRFFSMYSNRYENAKDKTYLQLFEAIEGQENYNEEALKKKFRSQAFVKQLHVTKNYLYNLILEALVQYNNKSEKTLHGSMMEIQVLHNKGLYDVAEKLNFKVRKIAEAQNDFLSVLETYRWEKHLVNLTRGGATNEEIDKLWEEEQKVMELYREAEECRLLAMQVHYYQNQVRTMPKEQLKGFHRMIETPLFKTTKRMGSAMANWQLDNSRGMYHLAIGKSKLANDFFAAAVKTMRENPAFMERNIGSAVNTMVNYTITSYLLKNYDESLNTINEVKDIVSKNGDIDMKRRFFRQYFIATGIYCDTGRLDEADKLVKEMQEQVDSGLITLDVQKVIFYLNSGAVYIFRGEYKKALQYINKVINYPGIESVNADVFYYGRLLEMICLLEMKEFDLLEYRIKSFHRYASKRNSPYMFEKELTQFIRKTLTGNFMTRKALLEAFIELKKSIDRILEDPAEAHAAQYFDFSGWLDSKVSDKPYAEVASQRAEKEVKR
jgi:tetratricopeptide (TPR) repeat protein